MKSSTIAIISAVTLLAVHGIHFFFGFKGVAVMLLAVAVFVALARIVYWRQLRKLRKVTRDLPSEVQEAIFEVSGLDAEAQKDIAKLEREERRQT